MLIYMYWFNLLTISLLCVYVKLLFALILLCVSQCTMRRIYIAYGNCKQHPSYYECCPMKCNPGITHNPNKVFKTVNDGEMWSPYLAPGHTATAFKNKSNTNQNKAFKADYVATVRKITPCKLSFV